MIELQSLTDSRLLKVARIALEFLKDINSLVCPFIHVGIFFDQNTMLFLLKNDGTHNKTQYSKNNPRPYLCLRLF